MRDCLLGPFWFILIFFDPLILPSLDVDSCSICRSLPSLERYSLRATILLAPIIDSTALSLPENRDLELDANFVFTRSLSESLGPFFGEIDHLEGPKHLSQYLKKLSVFPVHTVPLLFVKENFDKTEESKVSVRVFLQTSILRYLLAPLVRSHPVLQAGSHGGENTARNLFELPRGGQSSAADWVLLRLDLLVQRR